MRDDKALAGLESDVLGLVVHTGQCSDAAHVSSLVLIELVELTGVVRGGQTVSLCQTQTIGVDHIDIAVAATFTDGQTVTHVLGVVLRYVVCTIEVESRVGGSDFTQIEVKLPTVVALPVHIARTADVVEHHLAE